MLLCPVMMYLLDAQLAVRFPKLCENRFYVRLVRFLRRIAEFAYPKRLVLPVQLTLRSNTSPILVLEVFLQIGGRSLLLIVLD
jgi:hypothetical protein